MRLLNQANRPAYFVVDRSPYFGLALNLFELLFSFFPFLSFYLIELILKQALSVFVLIEPKLLSFQHSRFTFAL